MEVKIHKGFFYILYAFTPQMHICVSTINQEHTGGPAPSVPGPQLQRACKCGYLIQSRTTALEKKIKNIKIKNTTAPNGRFPEPPPYWIHWHGDAAQITHPGRPYWRLKSAQKCEPHGHRTWGPQLGSGRPMGKQSK